MAESKKPTAIFLGWGQAGEVGGKAAEVSTQVQYALEESFELLRSATYSITGPVVDLEMLAERARPDFLFNFGPTTIKKKLLDAVKVASINFHTAPPKWPGRGSCSFAILEGDESFGVTAHLMTEKIDAGAILRVIQFPVGPTETAHSLHMKTLDKIPALARAAVSALAKNDWKPKPLDERWEKPPLKQADLAQHMRINSVAESYEEIDRKVRAFTYPGKPGPYVELNGHVFRYEASGR